MPETLATALLNALKDRGADRIFGIPGDFVLPFFRVIAESKILPLHTLSHEPAVDIQILSQRNLIHLRMRRKLYPMAARIGLIASPCSWARNP